MIRFDLSKVPRISIDEAKERFDAVVDTVFVDVRSQAEFERAHIPGAICIPFREFPKRMREIPRDKEIITY